jgi:predicted dehydrogenase
MSQISLGIIGLGKIGLMYDLDGEQNWIRNQVMSHAGSSKKSEHFALHSLIDNDRGTLEIAQKLFPDVPCLTLMEALEVEGPEALIVSTPTESHLEVFRKVAKKWKPKILLIEKPMGNNSHDAKEIIDLIEPSSSFIYVNYFRRFLPHIRDFRDSAAFKSRGMLIKVEISAYGTLENIFSHFIDLVIFFEGPGVVNSQLKVNVFRSKSSLHFKDASSGIDFRLEGLGLAQRTCEMRLEYEQFIVHICENGRTIEILRRDESLLSINRLSASEFLCYQYEVLNQIGSRVSGPVDKRAAYEAENIHTFFESLKKSNV